MAITVRYQYDLARYALSEAKKASIVQAIRRNIQRVAPVDTGAFKASWRLEWKSDILHAYSRLSYAGFVELGNRNYDYHKFKIRDKAIKPALKGLVEGLPEDFTLTKPPVISDEPTEDAGQVVTGPPLDPSTVPSVVPSVAPSAAPSVVPSVASTVPSVASTIPQFARPSIISRRIPTLEAQALRRNILGSRPSTVSEPKSNLTNILVLAGLLLALENNNDTDSEEDPEGS